MVETVPILKVEQVSKHFPGVQALDDVRLDVYPGEVVGLVGENGAGKSTLVKILSGVISKDRGQIFLQDDEFKPGNPQEAHARGIVTIYQELAVVPGLTVAQNLFLNREPSRYPRLKLIDTKQLKSDADFILADLGLNISAETKVFDLTIAMQQMVEIARAVSRDARLILMDEPTSALSSKEVEKLFEIIQRLKNKGVSVIFISHRLEEILQIADRIIVMRDGHIVGTLSAVEATNEKIVRLMVGRVVGLFPKEEVEIGAPVLEVRNLSGTDLAHDINLIVRRGEIVGLAGLVGAGRTEVARLICGAQRRVNGQIMIDGKEVVIRNPSDAVKHGIGLVPENRKLEGLVLIMNVRENLTLTILKRIARWLGLINNRSQNEAAQHYVSALSIATPSLEQRVENLSGGNQQKVVLGKWLNAQPKVLILDEPTRGIDVGAKAEVHALMSDLAKQGMGILMISSEMPEILGMSDRIVVMCQGRITGEFQRSEATQEAIMTCATKFIQVIKKNAVGDEL